MQWDDTIPSIGSLSYCCMRAGGCTRRDETLLAKYPGLVENGDGELHIGPRIMER